MSKKNDNTFYLTGDAVVKSFQMATSISDDINWLEAGETNQVIGMYFNGQRWIMDRKAIFCKNSELDVAMDYLLTLNTDDRMYKLIEMYELVDALPEPGDV